MSISPFTVSSPSFSLLAARARRRSRRRIASPRDPVAAVLEPAQLESLQAALAACAELGGLDKSLALARALVEHLYGGDPSAWRLRSPKTLPLRTLAHALDSTPAALCRALTVFEVWTRAAEGHPWAQLSASHYRAVQALALPVQIELLEEAWREALSAEALRRRIATRGERRDVRGGRLPDQPIARAVTRIERELAAVDAEAISRTRDGLVKRDVQDLAARIESVGRRCLELARELRRR